VLSKIYANTSSLTGLLTYGIFYLIMLLGQRVLIVLNHVEINFGNTKNLYINTGLNCTEPGAEVTRHLRHCEILQGKGSLQEKISKKIQS